MQSTPSNMRDEITKLSSKLDELSRRTDQLSAKCSAMLLESKDRERVWLESLLGSEHQLVTTDRAAAEYCVTHSDLRIRFAALYCLVTRWELIEQYIEPIAEIAFSDAPMEFRLRAIGLLSLCHAQQIDLIKAPLVRLIHDASQQPALRLSVYRCIIRLSKRRTGGDILHAIVRDIAEIDWTVVAEFAQQ